MEETGLWRAGCRSRDRQRPCRPTVQLGVPEPRSEQGSTPAWGGMVEALLPRFLAGRPSPLEAQCPYLERGAYSFPVAAVANDHRPSGLEQHRFLIARLWGSKVPQGITRLKSRCWRCRVAS